MYGNYWKREIEDLEDGYKNEDYEKASNGMTDEEATAHGFLASDLVDGEDALDVLTRIWWLRIVELRSK